MANNPPQPNDISASGVTTIAALIAAFNDRLRTIRAWVAGGYVASPAVAAIDVNNQAVVNVPDPKDPQDAVNLRTLKRMQPAAAADDRVPTAGGVSFRAIARGYAELSIEDLVVKSAAAVDAVEFVAWAIDEADIGLRFALGASLPNSASSANVVNSLGLVGGISTDPIISGSRLGRAVGVGDFLYVEGEVVRVTGLTLSTMTLARGQLGSAISAHTATAIWYKINPYTFTVPARPATANMPARIVPEMQPAPAVAVATGGVPTRWDFAAPNLCVVAIAAAARTGSDSGPVTVVNYTKTGTNTPEVDGVSDFAGSPGLRTLSGAAYTDIGALGTLSAGQFADMVARVQAWHSIRNVYGFLSAPASGVVVAQVVYYAPDRLTGALLATLQFQAGDLVSQPVADADGVEMPGGLLWPPNIVPGLDMLNFRALYPVAAGGAPTLIVAGGWFDVVISQADGTSADLSVVIAV